VLFFELPCSTQLEGSRFAEITREIVHTAFADPGQWLHIDYRGVSCAGRMASIWMSAPL